MTGLLMVAALWAAAVYRVVLSLRSQKTVWRTAFTTCTLGVAVAATTSVFGDQTIDVGTGAWNVALLLTRLALTGASFAASIYVVTLRQEVVPSPAVRRRLLAAGILAVVEIVAWAAAPIHDRELLTTAEVNQSSAAGCVFAVAFGVAIVPVSLEVALFCFSKGVSRVDVTRTVSFFLTGAACVAGAGLITLGTLGVLVHQFTGRETTGLSEFLDGAVPLVAIVLALGPLSLLLAPPVVDLIRTYVRWRSLRPLWKHLVQLRPEVHLEVPATGGPLTRVHIRLQRAIVEIHDALRVTPVSVPPTADVNELAAALHRVGGPRMAGDVLAQARRVSSNPDDPDGLFALASSYARSQA